MTVLSDAELAELARVRDLVGDNVVRAVACALAVSGGDPAYHLAAWPGPVADRRGLWGVDVVAWPEYADVDLHHPDGAADVMADLVARTGGFGWCPAYRTGYSAHYLPRAFPAASTLPGRHRHDPPMAGGPIHAMIDSYRAAIARDLAALRRRSERRGSSWPRTSR